MNVRRHARRSWIPVGIMIVALALCITFSTAAGSKYEFDAVTHEFRFTLPTSAGVLVYGGSIRGESVRATASLSSREGSFVLEIKESPDAGVTVMYGDDQRLSFKESGDQVTIVGTPLDRKAVCGLLSNDLLRATQEAFMTRQMMDRGWTQDPHAKDIGNVLMTLLYFEKGLEHLESTGQPCSRH
ncbi:MAG: hypothetical protein KBD01_13945 [Acidobacteria bacterium]|nr:hypothetical protein [Acidobacteriota bacterium]